MPTYKVNLRRVDDCIMTVEAYDEDGALAVALDNAPDLCVSCGWTNDSHSVTAGEWYLASEFDAGPKDPDAIDVEQDD